MQESGFLNIWIGFDMSEAQKKADKKYYKKKKANGWFKLVKWIHKDDIKPISAQEIEAFCQRKAREGLKDLPNIEQGKDKK
jgi:hypothetical protein